MEAQSPEWWKRVVTYGALLAGAIPAGCLLIGAQKVRTFQRFFGLDDNLAMPEPTTLAVIGFRLALWPLIASWLLWFGVVVFNAYRASRNKSTSTLSPIAVFAAGTAVATVYALVLGGRVHSSGVDRYWPLLVMVLFMSSVLLGQPDQISPVAKTSVFRKLLDSSVNPRTPIGVSFLFLLVIFMMAAYATIRAENEAADVSAKCIEAPGVQVATAWGNIQYSTLFQVVSHENGYLFVRDSALPWNVTRVFGIPDREIQGTNFVRVPIDESICEASKAEWHRLISKRS